MRDIHTTIVSQHLAARDNNKILRTHPPQVSSTKENLPRHTRRTLAQLRTNKSPFLLSYLHKIDASTHPSPLCPLCRTHEHTIQHLFSCPQIHTTLSALDLWRDPSGVAALLDDWREKLAANPHKANRNGLPPISREEWVDNINTYNGKNIAKFNSSPLIQNWDYVYNEPSAQGAFTVFQRLIDLHIERAFPLQTVKMNYKIKHPWMTVELRLQKKMHYPI